MNYMIQNILKKINTDKDTYEVFDRYVEGSTKCNEREGRSFSIQAPKVLLNERILPIETNSCQMNTINAN